MNAVLVIEMALMIVVPVVVGLVVLWLARRTPPRFPNPARTSLILFALLVTATAFLSPGGDLTTPAVGAVVSAVVCAGVYIALRRRRVEVT